MNHHYHPSQHQTTEAMQAKASIDAERERERHNLWYSDPMHNPNSIEYQADAALDLLSAARTLHEQTISMVNAAQILIDQIARGKPTFPDDFQNGHAGQNPTPPNPRL